MSQFFVCSSTTASGFECRDPGTRSMMRLTINDVTDYLRFRNLRRPQEITYSICNQISHTLAERNVIFV